MRKSKIIGKIGRVLLVLVLMAAVGWLEKIEAVSDIPEASVSAETLKVVNGNESDKNSGLEMVLRDQTVGKWNGFNSVRKVVRVAVDKGIAADTIVLLLMLPLVATFVSVLHYIFGLTGYGIFIPTMLAVTMLSTGIFGGLVLFAVILLISLLSGLVLKRLKIHFWPARSINLLLISLGTFILMLVSPMFEFINLSGISIFPVLLMILLAEEFVRTQLVKSKKEAVNLTIGTLALSIVGALMMKVEWVQRMVILNPEAVILIVLVVNLLVGSYSGIRVAEVARFKKAIRKRNS